MGINTASYGCFFSSRLRKVLLKNEINNEDGQEIDFVFFGLNSEFNYWTFLSPDRLQNTVFESIKNAIQTKIILFPEKFDILFTIEDFDEMVNDLKLKNISFTPTLLKDEYFTSKINLPKLILFETQDGRKGAIKIKKTVNEGANSYIVTDIKIQKTASY